MSNHISTEMKSSVRYSSYGPALGMRVNMKAAKALGIKFPNSILVRANKAIE